MAKSKDFILDCNNCGSTEVEILPNLDYIFNGDSEILTNTGNIEIHCMNCDWTEYIYLQ